MNRLMLVVSLAASVFAGLNPAFGQGPPPATVRVDAAREERLMAPRAVTGEVVTLRRSLIAAQVEGLVIELALNPGDAVEKGAVIARLDDGLARLSVAQAEADLESALGLIAQREAELFRAERDLERVRTLSERGSATASELDAAEANMLTGRALLAQARAEAQAEEAALGLARRELADKTIIAPFAGRVVQKQAEIGEWVTPGDTIVELVCMDELEARIDVPEHLIGYLSEELGTIPLRIPALGAEPDAEAAVISVIPQADTLSRMFRVRLSVANHAGLLKPGMSLTAFVPTGSFEPVLTVHKDALLRDDAGEFVYMAVPFRSEGNPAITGQAVPARVDRLFAAGDRVAIRPGQVRAGSMLLVEGNERVFPTQPLVIQDAPEGSPFAAGAAEGGPN